MKRIAIKTVLLAGATLGTAGQGRLAPEGSPTHGHRTHTGIIRLFNALPMSPITLASKTKRQALPRKQSALKEGE